ncbi:MAG: LLM class flavin-dependent oxidoreductase, partial [Candidatus Hodarchaeota archaeon]
GRIVLGLGAGNTQRLQSLNIAQKRPALAIKECIKVIRGLIAGKAMNFNGSVIKLKQVKLGFKTRNAIPIYVAGGGPMVLQAAGEMADGVIIPYLTSPSNLKYAFKNITIGAEKADRKASDLDIVLWAYTAISEDGNEARTLMKPQIVRQIMRNKWSLQEIDVPEAIAKPVISMMEQNGEQSLLQAAKLIPDALVKHFSLAGTDNEIIEKIDWLKGRGIKQISVLPFPNKGERPAEVIERFAKQIMPHVK